MGLFNKISVGAGMKFKISNGRIAPVIRTPFGVLGGIDVGNSPEKPVRRPQNRTDRRPPGR